MSVNDEKDKKRSEGQPTVKTESTVGEENKKSEDGKEEMDEEEEKHEFKRRLDTEFPLSGGEA